MTTTSRKESAMSPSQPTRPPDDETIQHQADTSQHRTFVPEPRAVWEANYGRHSGLGVAHRQASASDRIGALTPPSTGFPTAPPRSDTAGRQLVDIDDALDLCEQITRAKACDLYQGIESLTAYRRRALCAIYAFACRVHHAAEGNLPPEEKLWLLSEARAGIPRDGALRPVDPVLVALRDTHRRFRLPLSALDDLIDGVECDAHGCIFDTFHELLWYCRQVGGSTARLSIAVLGSRDPVAAVRPADDLGVAIQLTTILRHLVEDFRRGRLYLPREDLARFGCPADLAAAPPDALARLVEYQVRRNREWYDRSCALLPLLDTRGATCVGQATAIQEQLLDRIERRPAAVARELVSTAVSRSARITVTALATNNGQTHGVARVR
jgi:phytoene synthase